MYNNYWYLLDIDGAMVTKWKLNNSKWYYFDEDGKMATGWIKDEDDWKSLYLKDDGSMATGWLKIKGLWYYFNDDGTMETGWLNYKGDYYYLDKTDGHMVVNTTIDGLTIGADGKFIPNMSGSVIVYPPIEFGPIKPDQKFMNELRVLVTQGLVSKGYTLNEDLKCANIGIGWTIIYSETPENAAKNFINSISTKLNEERANSFNITDICFKGGYVWIKVALN